MSAGFNREVCPPFWYVNCEASSDFHDGGEDGGGEGEARARQAIEEREIRSEQYVIPYQNWRFNQWPSGTLPFLSLLQPCVNQTRIEYAFRILE